MTPEEFQSLYPYVGAWIRQTLAAHANKAQTVASRGFTRLPLYFSGELLASTKFVALERLPMLPLSALGLSRFTPASFLAAYADGLERFGYRESPLEMMAYDAEASFSQSPEIFDAEKLVAQKLSRMNIWR